MEEDNPDKPSRQQLAIDRSHMANERTLLAYIRTTLAMFGFAVFILLQFGMNGKTIFYSITTFILSIAVLCIGIVRFYFYRKRINRDAGNSVD